MKSVATLADRVGQGAKGGAAATGITAASETLRTVAAVTNALTNTAGVTASIGFSKSKSTTATQEQAVVGSTIAGGTVNVTATGSDINVRGSSITSTNDTNLTAARDVILTSAANQIDSQFKSKSSGASIGVSVGVAVVGGVTASASVGVNASKSSGTSTETTQANSTVTAGGTFALTTGRDAILKGAVAQGQNVVASIGRDLSVESVQDTSSRSSTSAGFSAGLTLAPGVSIGANGSVNVGKGSGSSSIVSEQTALIAREGSLAATVKGNTDIKGGVIAAFDADGKDSGKLTLTTGTLTASDIKDSAKSRDISVGISASINNVTDKNTRSANLPVVDGSFASSSFKQDTKATIGQGTLTVGVPDANVTINRDIDQSQVVTKDKQTGFTVNIDPAAIREVAALVSGDKQNSVILQGVSNLTTDPLRIVKDVAAEIKAITDRDKTTESQTGELIRLVALKLGLEASGAQLDDALNVELLRAKPQLDALAAERDAALIRAETARASGDTAGEAAATAQVKQAETGIKTITTNAATSAVSKVALRSSPGRPQDQRVGDLTKGSTLVNRDGTLASGTELPGAPSFDPDAEIIVTAFKDGSGPTLGRFVVDGLRTTQGFVESLNPTVKSLTIKGIQAAATGGTKPLLDFAVDQASGIVLPTLPDVILRPIARAGESLNRFVGDGGAALLVGPSGNLTQDFRVIGSDGSANTRADSSATSFGANLIIGGSLGAVTKRAGNLIGKGKAGDLPDVTPGGPVQVGEVVSQREFKRCSVVGDNIEGDHSPSAAALIAAKERELGRELKPDEIRQVTLDGTVVAVPKDVHAESRTFKGRNTPQQIDQDSLDFIVAACKDAVCRANSLRKKGVSEAEIKRINDAVIAEAVKTKPKTPPKPPVPPKPKKPKDK